MEVIREEIVRIAHLFLGEEEIRGNLGFKNEKFQKLLEGCGWQIGQAWCAYLTELVWRKAYEKHNLDIEKELDKLFSAGAVNTFNNLSKGGYKTSKIPEPGDIVIWQHFKNGKAQWTGHAGIVIPSITESSFCTIEGNTNDDGSREGYKVAQKIRPYTFEKYTGLAIKGFIKPKEI